MSNWLLEAAEPHANLVKHDSVPAQFADVTLDGLHNPGLRSLVRTYGQRFWEVAEQGIAPLLIGPPATYKSYAAALLTKQIHQSAKVPTAWCTVPVDLTRIERKRYQPETDALIDRWKTIPFLVLDDFAMIRPNSWQFDVLLEIAMGRFEMRRPTMWTGNVLLKDDETDPWPQIERLLGIQLLRRMTERSTGFRRYVGPVK